MLIAPKPDERYTYKDYLAWPDHERWELIDGIAYGMSPSPSRRHQEVSLAFTRIISDYLDGKPCKLYYAPFDVRLAKGNEIDNDIDTVVQPDIVVVCDESKLDDKGCKGAPDLVIEILSEATAGKDLNEKLFLYERHGVKEYWIVDIWSKSIYIHKMGTDGKFAKPENCSYPDNLNAVALPGLEIDLRRVF